MDATLALLVANLMFFVLYVTAILVTRRSYGGLRGSECFAWSNGLRGLVMLAFLVRTATAPQPLNWVINVTVLVGFLALHRAFAELLHQPNRLWRAQVVATSLGAVGMAVASTAVHRDMFLAAMSFAMAGILGMTAWMLLSQRNADFRHAAERLTGALLAGYGALAIWRGLDALRGNVGWGAKTPVVHVVVWLLGSLVVNGGTAFGFVLIASVELARQLDLRAQTDALTGLKNRHGLEPVMVSIAGDTKVAVVSVVAMDIDNMKAANDRWGHEFGDAILRMVGSRLQGCLRGSDFGLRMGGDEFLIVLPGADETMAVQIADRLRQEIGQVHAEPGAGARVQASFGVATLPTLGLEWDKLLRCADEALYRAKNDGRNRVSIADSGLGVEVRA
jgi:diguanylate cyclase (GGDEF)-like protein